MLERPYFRTCLASVAVAALAACKGGTYVPSAANLLTAGATARSTITFRSVGPNNMVYTGGTPTSGKINAFAANPNDPGELYVASGNGTGLETYSSAGVFKTLDAGAHWTALTNGLIDAHGYSVSTINALWIDPNHPSTLLAASEYDGIYRTANAGRSWRHVAGSGRSTQFAWFRSTVYAASVDGILASRDGGATWHTSLAGSPRDYPTALGTAGAALYAGTSSGAIYSFTAGSWKKVGRIPYYPYGFFGGQTPEVHQIAVDPAASSVLYANTNDGTWDQALHASTDGGRTWNTIFKGQYLPHIGPQTIAFSAVFAHRLYVGENGALFYTQADGSTKPQMVRAAQLKVYDLRDIWIAGGKAHDEACWVGGDQGLDYEPACSTGARGADRVVTASLNIGLARHLAVAPTGSTIAASMQDFEPFITVDGGASWTAVRGFAEDGFFELKSGSNTCYWIDEIQFAVSNDGCRTFRYPSREARYLSAFRSFVNPIAFDPSNSRRIYIASMLWAPNFYSYKAEIVTTDNDGRSFAVFSRKFHWPGMIQIDSHDDRHMVVGDIDGTKSSLWVTFDRGAHWKRAAGVPETSFWYCASISPSSGKTILAASVGSNNTVFVLRSTDGGKHFTNVASVVNTPGLIARLAEDDTTRRIDAPITVYSPVREIRFNDGATGANPYVVLTTQRGAYLSTDTGASWKRIDGSLVSHSFWGTRWVNGYLYLASDGQGVVRSTQPVQ